MPNTNTIFKLKIYNFSFIYKKIYFTVEFLHYIPKIIKNFVLLIKLT